MLTRVLIFILALSTCCLVNGESYTKGMFKTALKEDSTSSLYVLVNIPKYGNQAISIDSQIFLTAIIFEHGFASDRAGRKQAIGFAMANFGKPFYFLDARALENVKPRYGQAELKKAESLVAGMRKGDIIKKLRATDSSLHNFYNDYRDASASMAHQDALAHVLLKRGILVGTQCRTGSLFVW